MKTVVICPDSRIRHLPFDDEAEAEQWIEWGHCCLSANHHHIITVTDAEVRLISTLSLWMMMIDIIAPKELT